MVFKKTCKSSHKKDLGLRQTFGKLISYIHHTNDYRQFCHVGNTAQLCRLGLFQDSDFAGDLEDSKSTSGGVLCIFGSRTFVPVSWMCKKQTSVSHSSAESEIISLDAGLRMDGVLAFDLWDVVIEVSRSTNNTARPSKLAQGDLCTTGDHSINKHQTKTTTEKRNREVEQLSYVDYAPINTHSSQGESQLYICEDKEGVIKTISKGRSPTMRHVSRTHRVALDWLFDRINLEPKIQIKNVDTKSQLADMLTKGSFTRDEWTHLLRLFNIMNFSVFSCIHFSRKQSAMSKGGQKVLPVKVHQWQNQSQRIRRWRSRDP